jgi:hypothetical protein|nr:MAG TPA: hypothetical protein [Caudoviricetes sp.]DAS93023.1 MAG TPA: hypothetical protein [Caudoviricetes sp.]DAY08861.1 MAG TPA: hypothetical protein [Caudoviricetes sp.]
MTTKELIFNTITGLELDIPLSYGFSDGEDFPKLVYFHVGTMEKRSSNKKFKKHHTYQLNLFDVKPHDLDNSEILIKLQTAIEDTTLNTGAWHEIIDVDEDTKETQFMYYMEIYS